MMRKVLKFEDGPRDGASFPSRRYEVHYKAEPSAPWTMWSTNFTKWGAYFDYWLTPLGCHARRVIDNGKDWRN